MPIQYDHDHDHEVTLFAETNFRNTKRRFGIKTDDRRRHVYVIGKTGMGKTTLLENIFVSDINQGHGCCYVDPHGDTAERLIDFIPPERINDVVYFNPADVDFPLGFNILETEAEWQKPLVASGLMGVFKKIWPDVWSPRMEYILMNCVLALLDMPGATLMGINRILVDKEYRARVVAHLRDPIVKTFWVAEFTQWSEKYATEAIAPVQNKVGQFLSSAVIRNIVAQVKSTINLRRIMDDGKILIVNLSKGRIGEDNMRLLGGMLITKIQLAAQERQNISELERRDFYLYVDEFQNFANESFASILSEARKYRLNLLVAHQYIEQLDEKVAAAIFGNVGTIIAMRVGGADAAAMETEFAPVFLPEDLTNLAKTQIYLKLMVDGVATRPFSANTLPPIAKHMQSEARVIAVSRERYAEPRATIEEKVLRWSGMEIAASLGKATAEAATGIAQGDGVALGADDANSMDTGMGLRADADAGDVPAGKIEYPKLLAEDEHSAPVPDYLVIRPERMAAITASVAASTGRQPKKEKPKFPHTCSRCGKTWDLPIQLDTSRPMYCPDCMPIVREERKKMSEEIKKVLRSPPPPERVVPAERGTVKVVRSDASSSSDPSLMDLLRPSSVGGDVSKNEAGEGGGGVGKKRRRKKRGGKKLHAQEGGASAPAHAASTSSSTTSASTRMPVSKAQMPEIVAFPDIDLRFDVSTEVAPQTARVVPPAATRAIPPGQHITFD